MAKKQSTRVNKKAKRGDPCATQLRKQLAIRFSDEDYAWVLAAAASEDRTAANFMRRRILQGKEQSK